MNKLMEHLRLTVKLQFFVCDNFREVRKQCEVMKINRPHFPHPRNTGDHFLSPHIDRGTVEVNMVREIIKLVFSRTSELSVLSEE